MDNTFLQDNDKAQKQVDNKVDEHKEAANKVDKSEEEIKDQMETPKPTGTKATGTRLKKYHPQEQIVEVNMQLFK